MGRLITYKVFKVTIILCFLNILAIAQEASLGIKKLPRERVCLSSNSTMFLVGETLYYNFFNFISANNTPSSISKIGYVELIGENGECLFKHKLKLDKGLGYGDYFIPSNIETGHYKLVAYTKWMENSNPFSYKNIYIINPFVSNFNNNVKESVSIEINQTEKEAPTIKTNNIQIETKSNSAKPRSLVSIDLKNSFGYLNYGNYSLSVRKVSPITVSDTTVLKDNNEIIQKSNFNFFPEIRGEIISGVVKSKLDDALVSNIVVSLSIPGKQFVLKNVKTNQSGRFYFSLSENYNSSQVLVQVFDENKNDYKIVLDDPNFYDFSNIKLNKIHLNQNLKDYLIKQSIYNQIENTYYNSKRDSIINKLPSTVFYYKPDKTYVLDDYKRFPTLRETFIEIVLAGGIRYTNDKYKFKVYKHVDKEDMYSTFYGLDPLVLLDGILIQNGEDIMDYDARKIESISLVRGAYFYGPNVFYGIIDIKTKNGDFKLPENSNDKLYFNLDASINSKVYYTPKYVSETSDLKRIPDYRTQLLWLPNIHIDSDLKTIEFYTSDVEDTFEIVLEGYTFTGNKLVERKYFEVKK